jgi:hypothetical protein
MRVSTLLPIIFGLPAFATLVDTRFPALLLPLKKSRPDTAFPTQNDAMVSYNVCIHYTPITTAQTNHPQEQNR